MRQLFLRLSKLAIVMLIVLSLSSCGYKDIDKRAFVVTIGVDKAESDDKKYKVMLKIAIPASDVRAGEPESIISEKESNSITDAVRMMKTKVDKEIEFSHAKAIIFGEKIMEEDIQEMLDWFIRRRDIQKIAWVGVGKPNAEEILKLNRKVERLPSNALFLSFGNNGTESAYIVSEYLFDFRKRITEKGIDPILPIIEAKEQKYFEINKAAVFDNKKLRITLSEEETKILNILLNRTKKGDVRVEEQGKDENQNSFFISVDEAKANYKIKNDFNSKPIVEVNVQMEGIIEEALMDLTDDRLEECKEIAEKQVKEKIVHLLKKLQKEQLDPIGFGLQYRANSFQENDWEQWQSMYPDVEFKVHVDILIQGTGLLS